MNPLTIASVTPMLAEARPGLFQYFFMVGVFAALTIAVFLWAVFFRKHHEQRPHRHRSSPNGAAAPAKTQPVELPQKNKHRRHRRSSHRPRNPTLAETSGLPPARPPAPPKSLVPPDPCKKAEP